MSACASDDLAPSIWPPADFACVVEEVQVRDGTAHVLRRFRIGADGLAVYGTSSRSLVDAETGTALPVFERLTAYQLVPASLRAFARRIDRLGINELDPAQGERSSNEDTGLVLRWQAFGNLKTIMARGRVGSAMAEILSVVTAHLPSGERFVMPGQADRPVVPVLRGVPAPVQDPAGALQAHESLLARCPDDTPWLLDAYALACATGARASGEQLLQRWTAATAEARKQTSPFPETGNGLAPEVLRRLLPPP